MEKSNITIIGCGVIGLAIAYLLSEKHKDILVLEKNSSFGEETSSRNSEVIHAGLYYQKNSLKASTCIRGNKLLYEICKKYNIAHKKTGKLVISTTQDESALINDIFNNALECGVENLKLLEKKDISKLEPDINAQIALFSPDTGIIDSHGLMKYFFEHSKSNNVEFAFDVEVVGIEDQNSGFKITVKEPQGDLFDFNSNFIINASGLNADKISSLAGIEDPSYELHLCKGQYFRINHPKKFSINHLIYPPPSKIDLGIHITLDLASGLRLGPDANYVESIDYKIDENDSLKFYNSVKRFLKDLDPSDLIPDTAGIRPKLQKKNGPFRDFIIKEESDKGKHGFINLIGIESPGLTSCLAIAEMVEKLIN